MAKRIQDYTPDPLFPTPGLPRILQLRQIKAQTYMTPGEQRELKRLEETQQTMEFLYHRGKRRAARRKQSAATPSETP
jgi:hypothetical protein